MDKPMIFQHIGVTNEKAEQLQKMMTCSNDYA
jgi:hypothetical protein